MAMEISRAARASPDGRTVALVFGTNDFLELQLNWACHALNARVRWFVLVAMDWALYNAMLQSFVARHVILLPCVRQRTCNISKLNVIGERQRYGLSLLRQGYSVVHSDADALWLRNPWPLFRTRSDIVAERIWGKPLSVVRAWGAAICTGFYFLRSTPAVIAVVQTAQAEIVAKRARQPGWQASDQYYINTVLHRLGVTWEGPRKMAPVASMATRYYDLNASHGSVATPRGGLRLTMLAHALVPRACPVLSAVERASMSAAAQSSAARPVRGKAKLWRSLLHSAFVVHCFN